MGNTGPIYRQLHALGGLHLRLEGARSLLAPCILCPRRCGADRLEGGRGRCGAGPLARIAGAHPHFGEEAPLVGRGGSGTIFFSHCSLRCSFCQNADISHLGEGDDLEAPRIADLMLGLQERGCSNLNLVTPTHVLPQILEALEIAADRGLELPLVWNCGGYESLEVLRLLDGVVDIYLPDFKFWDEARGRACCGVPDYRSRACEALLEMHRQVGDLVLDGHGLAVRGLLVRHLVMPNGVAGSTEVMDWIARELGANTYVNVMAQYRPCWKACEDPKIARRLREREFEAALAAARRAGLYRGLPTVP